VPLDRDKTKKSVGDSSPCPFPVSLSRGSSAAPKRIPSPLSLGVHLSPPLLTTSSSSTSTRRRIACQRTGTASRRPEEQIRKSVCARVRVPLPIPHCALESVASRSLEEARSRVIVDVIYYRFVVERSALPPLPAAYTPEAEERRNTHTYIHKSCLICDRRQPPTYNIREGRRR